MSQLSVVITADGVRREFFASGDGPVVVAAFRAWLSGPDGHLPMAEGVDELERQATELEQRSADGGPDPNGLTPQQWALVEAHLDWAKRGAYKRAYTYRGRYSVDELWAAAVDGLIVAAKKFKPELGFTFKTYAMNWTEGLMQRLDLTTRRAMGGSWRNGNIAMIAHVNSWPTNEDGEQLDLADRNPVDPADAIHQEQVRRYILECAKTDRERQTIALTLDGKVDWEIAKALGVSRKYVWMVKQRFYERARRNRNLRLIARQSA